MLGTLYKFYKDFLVLFKKIHELKNQVDEILKAKKKEVVDASFCVVPKPSSGRSSKKRRSGRTHARKKQLEPPLSALPDKAVLDAPAPLPRSKCKPESAVPFDDVNADKLQSSMPESSSSLPFPMAVNESGVLQERSPKPFAELLAAPTSPDRDFVSINEDVPAALIAAPALSAVHQKVLFELFDPQSRKVMMIRELVGLAVALGGTITKSGANRCRIELNNIYASVLASHPDCLVSSAQPLSSAHSSTVTMHGGCHRSKASQNHDRGTAPRYLVEQFRAALTRANCTPKLLFPAEAVSKQSVPLTP